MDELQAFDNRQHALETRFSNEAGKTIKQLVAASVMCFSNVNDCGRYNYNDQYQSVLQRPLRDWRNLDTWKQREQLLDDMGQHALRVVKEHVDCVHSRGRGIIDAEPVGVEGTSFLVQHELMFLHIWQNRREARRFFNAFQRLAQILFDFKIGCSLHVPLTSIVLHQGVTVSVTWVPPLVNDACVEAPAGTLLQTSLERVQNILHSGQLQLYLGGDARCYFMCANELMCHPVSSSSFVENSNECRFEWLLTLPKVPHSPFRLIQSELIPTAVRQLCAEFDALDPARTSVPELITRRVIPNALHSNGVNIFLLYEVLQCPLLSCKSPQATQMLSYTILTEMIARTAKSVITSVFRGANVPDYVTGDVQTIQRIVVANQTLERLCKVRSFINEILVPVMIKKFGVPVGFSVSAAAYSLRGVLDHLKSSVGVEYDGTGKHIARFVTTSFCRSSAFVTPRLVEYMQDMKLASVLQSVQRLWEDSSRWEEMSLRWLSQRIMALQYSCFAHSPFQDDFFRELRASLDSATNPALQCYFSGVLAETATTKIHLESLASRQLESLKEFTTVEDRPCVGELLRVAAKLLSSTGHETMALPIFDEAVAQFSSLFQMENRSSSAIHFDLLLFRTLNALRCIGPCACVERGLTHDLLQSSEFGLDSNRRKDKVAATFFLFGSIAVESCTTPSMWETIIPCSSAAITLHVSMYGSKDNRTAIMNYFHLFCLCMSGIERLRGDSEAVQILSQYRTILGEMFRDELPEAFINSEWMIGAMGRLINVAMSEGMWHGAVAVLQCASERYMSSDEFPVGKYSLEGPLQRLKKANFFAGRIFHYWCRCLRNRLNPQVAIFERLHRIGIMVMEQIRRRTMNQFQEAYVRTMILLQKELFCESVERGEIHSAEAAELVRPLVLYEGLSRHAIPAERYESLETDFLREEALFRHFIVFRAVAEKCMAVDYLSGTYRSQLTLQEAAEFGKLEERLELMQRISLMYCEQIARRELLYLAASRVMHRVLQNSMILRVVPVLSMYFFSEEQNVRLVLEEEAATGLQELRLKEQIFRNGMSRRESDKKKTFNARLKTRVAEAALADKLKVGKAHGKTTTTDGADPKLHDDEVENSPDLPPELDGDLDGISRTPRTRQGTPSLSPVEDPSPRCEPRPRLQSLQRVAPLLSRPPPPAGVPTKTFDRRRSSELPKLTRSVEKPRVAQQAHSTSHASGDPKQLQSQIQNLWSSIVTQERRSRATGGKPPKGPLPSLPERAQRPPSI